VASTSRVSHCVEFRLGKRDDLPWPHPDVHQPLDRAQFGDLVERVLPLAVVVAHRLGESVTALPHAEHVLGEPGIALDGADVEFEVVSDLVGGCLRHLHG